MLGAGDDPAGHHCYHLVGLSAGLHQGKVEVELVFLMGEDGKVGVLAKGGFAINVYAQLGYL